MDKTTLLPDSDCRLVTHCERVALYRSQDGATYYLTELDEDVEYVQRTFRLAEYNTDGEFIRAAQDAYRSVSGDNH